METGMIIAVAVVLGLLVIKIFKKPISGILKFLIHAAFGYVLLFVFNFFAGTYGLTIEINTFTAAIAGFGGVPGVIFLIILKLFV